MARRTNYVKKPDLPFWKQDGDLWYADGVDLAAAISASPNSEEEIRKRMGAGYHHLEEELNGKRLNQYEVSHIEWGLTPESIRHHAPNWLPK